MSHPKLAAQLYTIREYTQTLEDFRTSMEKVRDIGYTAVQVSAIGPIPFEDVKAVVNKMGLTICITHIGFDRLQTDIAGVVAAEDINMSSLSMTMNNNVVTFYATLKISDSAQLGSVLAKIEQIPNVLEARRQAG